MRLFRIRQTPLVGDLLAVGWLALFHSRHLKIVKTIRGKSVASPLDLRYWSGSPHWLGQPGTADGHAVKYSLVPRYEGTTPPNNPNDLSADYLSRALAGHLKTREADFDFRVQPQIDPVTMPVEDTSVEWDEGVSKPIPVATLTIGVQDVNSSEGRALAEECEAMSFSPWNARAEHRPMGGINRLRQSIWPPKQRGLRGGCREWLWQVRSRRTFPCPTGLTGVMTDCTPPSCCRARPPTRSD